MKALALGLVMAAGAVAAAAPASVAETPLLELPGVHRLFASLAPDRASAGDGERAAAWADLSLLVGAIAGEAVPALSATMRVVITPAIASRDAAAYRLLAVGYSAHETADVLSGRISRQALDTARTMIMTGSGRKAASEFLDRQYRRAADRPAPEREAAAATASPLAAAIARSASANGLDASIVTAVIAVESRFNPAARSRAGAVGLMQLMPATARALGVNPWVPEQNLEGGVRHLAALLRMFGGLELALVAYNGGPGYARRFARGQAALYGETREYVRQVLARLAGAR